MPDPATLPVVLGQPAWHVQSDVRKTASARGGDAWLVRLRGTRAEILQVEKRLYPGCTYIPGDAADWIGDAPVRLDDSDLQGADGGFAELTLRYVRRNAREADVGGRDGLVSRDVQYQPCERQETLEHFLARKGSLDLALLDAWRNEPDPAAKAAFRVSGADGGAPAELSGLTLKAAQRLALGIEYVPAEQDQVVVEEVYRLRPEGVDLTPNVVLRSGLPEKHRPDFGAAGGSRHWMRKSVTVESPGPSRWLVRTVYLGLPAAFKPSPAPDDWGESAFDGLLYESE